MRKQLRAPKSRNSGGILGMEGSSALCALHAENSILIGDSSKEQRCVGQLQTVDSSVAGRKHHCEQAVRDAFKAP